MSLPTVGKFCLTNTGFFKANMNITYYADNKRQQSEKSPDVLIKKSYVQDPNQCRIPDGSRVQLHVNVIFGLSKDAHEQFLFNRKSSAIAFYTVSGHLFKETLTYDGTDVPDWVNWSQNVLYQVPDGTYFIPVDRDDLSNLVREAGAQHRKVRVSGQRHSQAQLVTVDRRDDDLPTPSTLLIDLACYADLGVNESERIQLNGNLVTVNAGVREDELNAFLTKNNKMLPTSTAGGFFSLGGITSVDVHGSTVEMPIFSENVKAFNVMGPDGKVNTIDSSTSCPAGYNAMQFARVNVGALGVVTSVTLEVLDRPYANNLEPNLVKFDATEEDFVNVLQQHLLNHDRVETFLNPYSKKCISLIWDVVEKTEEEGIPNVPNDVPTSCALADNEEYGAPYLDGYLETSAQVLGRNAQNSSSSVLADSLIVSAFLVIETMFLDASLKYTDLWLTEATRTMLMSYFIELPNLDEAGLQKAWLAVETVMTRLSDSDFFLAAPVEFRFLKGGDTALAGTFTKNPDAYFVNFEIIGFVKKVPGSEYPDNLKRFFADIERKWIDMGGLPHNGKMFGFFDPTDISPTSYSGPFNDKFMQQLAKSRSERVAAFERFRAQRDPEGVFCNDYVSKLLGIS